MTSPSPPAPGLDHLVVAAASLAEGTAWVEDLLGVPLEAGGEHPQFGTHNTLLSLGPSCYLEVISVDPQGPQPERPRWFALDTTDLLTGPRLHHWVVRPRAMAGRRHVESFRRGDLRWQLTVPPDGSLEHGGLVPSCIHWETAHPCSRLPDHGVRLDALQLRTPEPERLREELQRMDVPEAGAEVVPAQRRQLLARLTGPAGTVELSEGGARDE